MGGVRGRKECVGCGSLVGVRTRQCKDCGYDFQAKEVRPIEKEETPEIRTYDEGGPGRKQCSNCQKYIGARTKACACGYVFPVGEKPSVETSPSPESEKETEAEVAPPKKKAAVADQWVIRKSTEARRNAEAYGWKGTITCVPSGECPFKLKDTDEQTVHEWCRRTIESRIESHNSFLCGEALKYFANHFYRHFTKEHDQVSDFIDSFFDDQIGNDSTAVERDQDEDEQDEFDDDILNEPYDPKEVAAAVLGTKSNEGEIEING